MQVVNCENCGEAFECPNQRIENNDHLFCSRDCYFDFGRPDMRGENHHDWDGGKETIECEQCGDAFEVHPYEIEDGRKFCSKKCANKGQQYTSGDGHHNYSGGKITTFCRECGQPFGYYNRSGDDNPKYCSKECYDEAKKERMKGTNNPVWRGGYPRYYGANWDEQREKALERDGHTCQRCGVHESDYDRPLHVHHKTRLGWYREEYDAPEWWEKGNALDNLATLCDSCHKKTEWE